MIRPTFRRKNHNLVLLLLVSTLLLSGCSYIQKIRGYFREVHNLPSAVNPITIEERNQFITVLTDYQWQVINKHNILTLFDFRSDDDGFIVALTRNGQQSPEYYLTESARGYQLDLAQPGAYVRFELSPNHQPSLMVKKSGLRNLVDAYWMIPTEKKEVIDDSY
jgi:hypothetical protein